MDSGTIFLTINTLQYRAISSFVKHPLVAQDRVHLEHHVREADGAWRMTETNDITGYITLRFVPITLLVRDVYTRIIVDGIPLASPQTSL